MVSWYPRKGPVPETLVIINMGTGTLPQTFSCGSTEVEESICKIYATATRFGHHGGQVVTGSSSVSWHIFP